MSAPGSRSFEHEHEGVWGDGHSLVKKRAEEGTTRAGRGGRGDDGRLRWRWHVGWRISYGSPTTVCKTLGEERINPRRDSQVSVWPAHFAANFAEFRT